jgi:hypothetical protein
MSNYEISMVNDMIVEATEEFYNNLRDEPCILCSEPYSYVLGSYKPEQLKHSAHKESKTPVLYYTLCERCYNKGSIPTARIEGAYRNKFSKMAA